MRTFGIWSTAVLACALGGAGLAIAADCGCQQQSACACNGNGAGYCDPCGGDGCGLLFCNHRNRGPRFEGLDPGFNCGCNGSYKFPVPPLYTYHWPGMWQHHLMTDYHSPWRFPPLKPYVDEAPTGALGTAPASLRRVQQASAYEDAAPSSERVSFSGRLEQMLR